MSSCWRCGTDIPASAAFCPGCGQSVGEQSKLIDPFATDGPVEHVTADRAGAARWPVAIGALLLVGLVAFFVIVGGDDAEGDGDDPGIEDAADSNDEPDAEGAEPEEAQPDQSVTGDTTETGPEPRLAGRLTYESPLNLGDAALAGIESVGESEFVFTFDGGFAFRPGPATGALRAFERTPDGAWTEHGVVLDGIGFRHLTSGPDGVVAVGIDDDRRPTMWTSPDGVTWASETLPELDSERPIEPAMVAVTDDVTVVAGHVEQPYVRFLNETDALGIDLAASFGWRFDGETLEISDAFGLIWERYDLTELGLENPERAFANTNPFIGGSWVRPRGGDWADAAVTPQRADFLTAGIGGELLRVGGSALIERSRDGIEWTAALGGMFGWNIQVWRDEYVMFTDRGTVTRVDADLATRIHLPLPDDEPGAASRMAAGDAGLMVQRSNLNETFEPPTVVVFRNGLVVRFMNGQIEAEIDGGVVTWLPSDPQSADLVLDPDTEIASFLDPSTGEVAFEFTRRELGQIWRELGETRGAPPGEILFTGDGETWLANPLESFLGEETTVADLHVGDDLLFAAVWEQPDRLGFGTGDLFLYEARIDPAPAG